MAIRLIGLWSIIGCVLLFAVQAQAEQAEDVRAQTLFRQIRCQVCKGESIDESQAKLAKDMRELIVQQLKQGQSEAQIKTFLVERYGASVLMETPVNTKTIWLWLLPLIVLILGIGGVAVQRRQE